TIQPGEEFEVEIIFDPIAHGPKATGPVDRRVSLFSSGDKTIEISVTANVLAEEEYLEKYKDSPFSFEEMEHDFGVVKQSSGINSYDFEFAYLGKDPITVTATPTSCACTEAEISQKNFKKGDTGILTVHFDPNLHEEPEGKFFKTISILTDPALEKQPEVKIWAEMNLDLGEEAYKQKQHTE
ncbi:DUF1573 domain-containing protein, partial [Candidatus Peregrinibacteria bacterium]|nr:DUF1573 domain-containing protein [Candidatus Peregrinibacteria bacterium]